MFEYCIDATVSKWKITFFVTPRCPVTLHTTGVEFNKAFHEMRHFPGGLRKALTSTYHKHTPEDQYYKFANVSRSVEERSVCYCNPPQSCSSHHRITHFF